MTNKILGVGLVKLVQNSDQNLLIGFFHGSVVDTGPTLVPATVSSGVVADAVFEDWPVPTAFIADTL